MTTTTSFQLKLPKFKFRQQFDVYLLGVTLIEIINGQWPSRLDRVVKKDRRKFYDPRVLDLIQKMVAHRPEDRPTFDEIWDSDIYSDLFHSKERYVFEGYGNHSCKMFDGMDCGKAWKLFHNHILAMTNRDKQTGLKYEDDMFSSKRKESPFWIKKNG